MTTLATPRDNVPLIPQRESELRRELERVRALPCVCELTFCLPCRTEVRIRREIASLRDRAGAV